METENKKLGNEPAFPVENLGQHSYPGMSKRFYAACQIAPPLISSLMSDRERAQNIHNLAKENGSSYRTIVIKMVYELVDELLTQE